MKKAQRTQPYPFTGPPNHLYVPDSVRSQVLQWAHVSWFACYLGINLIVSQLQLVSVSPLCPPVSPSPPSWIVYSYPAFTVWQLLAVCLLGHGFKYLVDWEGYVPEEPYWKFRQLILDPSIVHPLAWVWLSRLSALH